MAFWIENIIFPLLYDHPLVAQKGGYFDRLVVAELYIVRSVSLLQTFQVVIITADIAIGKSGIHCSTMYRFRDLPLRIERLFGWSPALLLFAQIWFYQFRQDVFVYAESERFKVPVPDVHSFDHAYGFVLFVHFYLQDGFRLVVEFRADVTTRMFIILVLMQDCMDMDLFVVRPLHEFRDNFGRFTG